MPSLGVTPAWRVGDTIRRATGPWTPTIHALLAHLDEAGFTEAPRVLGIDEHGREVLTWVDGESTDWRCSDAVLAGIGRLARRLRTTLDGWVPAPDLRTWRTGIHEDGFPILHNDFAPWNVIVRGDAVVGLIDWDVAGPRPVLDDIAYAAWRACPLDPTLEDQDPVAFARWPERLAILADSYMLDGDERIRFPEAILARTIRACHAVAWAVEHGDDGLARVWNRGSFAGYCGRSATWIDEHRASIERALT